jgi:hypothetical protein
VSEIHVGNTDMVHELLVNGWAKLSQNVITEAGPEKFKALKADMEVA